MNKSLLITSGSQGGFVVTSEVRLQLDPGLRLPTFLFAGSLAECLEFIRKEMTEKTDVEVS